MGGPGAKEGPGTLLGVPGTVLGKAVGVVRMEGAMLTILGAWLPPPTMLGPVAAACTQPESLVPIPCASQCLRRLG